MALIKFKRLPDESTPATPENINYNFELLSNMITIMGPSTNFETTSESEYSKIPFTYEYSKVGDKLTFDTLNNSIKIGPGVSHIAVSIGACIQLNGTGMTYQRLHIYKNNNEINISTQSRQTTSTYTYVNLTDILIPVNENDLISAKVFNRLAGSFNVSNQYMSVKVID